jgi:hypothetical protein
MAVSWKIPDPAEYFDNEETQPVPTTEIVRVTGRVARAMLEHNRWHKDNKKVDKHDPSNRKFSEPYHDGLVAAVLAGDWQLTHQGVAFDTDGNLVDGQHRLFAIVTASGVDPNVAVDMMVTYHLAPGAFRAVDVGKKRTAGDVLSIAGEASTVQLAATTRLVINYDRLLNGEVSGEGIIRRDQVPTVDEVFHRLDDEPGIRDSVHKWAGTRSTTQAQRRFITPSALYATNYLFMRAGHTEAVVDEFWSGVFEGSNLIPNDARLALRNNLYNARVGRRKTISLVDVALAIKAFNAWVIGRPVHTLSWRNNEAMPTIATPETATVAA